MWFARRLKLYLCGDTKTKVFFILWWDSEFVLNIRIELYPPIIFTYNTFKYKYKIDAIGKFLIKSLEKRL